MAENLVKKHANDWIILRCGGLVGEGMKKSPVFDLLNNKPLWVDVESCFQYINTDTLAKTLFLVLEKRFIREIVNVCGSGSVSLKEIIARCPVKVDLKYACDKPEKIHYEINNDKLKKFIAVPDTIETIKEFAKEYVRGLP